MNNFSINSTVLVSIRLTTPRRRDDSNSLNRKKKSCSDFLYRSIVMTDYAKTSLRKLFLSESPRISWVVWSERPKCSASYSYSSSTSRRQQTSSIIETFSDIFINYPRLHDIVHVTTKCHCFVLHTIANDIFSLTSSVSAP